MKVLQTAVPFAVAMIAVLALGEVARAESPLGRTVNAAKPWTIDAGGNALVQANDSNATLLAGFAGFDSDGGCCASHDAVCCDHGHASRFHLTEFNIYPTFSYLRDQSASYTEFEFASHTDFGFLEMENRTVLNVADLPSTIKLGPTNPSAQPLGPPAGIRANGFGDILSGFFFSRQGAHEQKTHLGIGPVLTFPTASNDQLGSSQFTAGPGIHFSTEINRLTAGFFLWQSWGFGESLGKKKVNQLFGKPFFIYEVSEKWQLIYIPLGLSHSWDAPSGDNWTVPIGGGIRRLCEIRGQKMGLQFQAFDYVARKSKDPEWELRATIEFLFD